MPKLHEMIV